MYLKVFGFDTEFLRLRQSLERSKCRMKSLGHTQARASSNGNLLMLDNIGRIRKRLASSVGPKENSDQRKRKTTMTAMGEGESE